MRKLSYLFSVLLLLTTSCDDGEVIDINLEFDEELELCANGLNYVVYDIKTDPYESITILFPVNDSNNLIFNPVDNPHSGTLTINGSSIKFNYRTYDGDPIGELICEEIPSSTVNITKDYPAEGGTIEYHTTYEDIDNRRYITVAFTVKGLDLEILNSTEEFLGTYQWDYEL
jgi:hypothetical protein